jgi:hypothetical protein
MLTEHLSEQSLHELQRPVKRLQYSKKQGSGPLRPDRRSAPTQVREGTDRAKEKLDIQASIIKPVQNEEYLDRPALPESLPPKAVDGRQLAILKHTRRLIRFCSDREEVSAPKSPRET